MSLARVEGGEGREEREGRVGVEYEREKWSKGF